MKYIELRLSECRTEMYLYFSHNDSRLRLRYNKDFYGDDIGSNVLYFSNKEIKRLYTKVDILSLVRLFINSDFILTGAL